MSTTKERIGRAEAERLASEVADLLRPACLRIEVAGSIRRRRETIGDLEIVAIPQMAVARDMFGQAHGSTNLLDAQCALLEQAGVFGRRVDKNGVPRWGSGLKWATYKGMNLDLFAVTGKTAQWGVIFLVRTGSADFSHRLVTPSEREMTDSKGGRHRGWMPSGMWVRDGALWRTPYQLVSTPEESDVFAAIGREWVDPTEREV